MGFVSDVSNILAEHKTFKRRKKDQVVDKVYTPPPELIEVDEGAISPELERIYRTDKNSKSIARLYRVDIYHDEILNSAIAVMKKEDGKVYSKSELVRLAIEKVYS